MALVVSDDRGGKATQRFMLHVRTGTLNTPPLFTTRPPVRIDSETSYLYDADAVDLEGGTLTFALVDPPTGPSVDSGTGEVTWEEPADGSYELVLKVTDPQGASATQAWTLVVGSGGGGNGPVITTLPPLEVGVGGMLAYVPRAEDPDDDVLTWSLPVTPGNVHFEEGTGRIIWQPTSTQTGTHGFLLAVTDGTHTALQEWTVTVSTMPPNRPPVFTTAPHHQAQKDVEYRYAATARDPEGEKVTYDLLSPSSGVAVSTSGVVTFTSTTTGTISIVLRAQDPQGAAALQSWVVHVREDNAAPVVWADPVRPLAEDVPWTHQAYALDPDFDVVTFSLRDAPDKMRIDPVTGVLTWTPSTANQSWLVTVVGTDPIGAEGTAELALVTVRDDTPPLVEVRLASGEPACEGRDATVCVFAEDDVTAIRWRSLTANGTRKVLDEHGCVELTWGTFGSTTTFVGAASDSSSNVGTATLAVAPIECPEYLAFPKVDFTSPVSLARVGVPTPVTATMQHSSDATALTSWRLLAYRPTANGSVPADALVLVDEGNPTALPNLATFDPTKLANGLWTLRAEAYDDAYKMGWNELTVEVFGDFKPGRFKLAFEDFKLPHTMTPVSVVRSYDTLDIGRKSDFGPGWSLQLADMEVVSNGPLGARGWGAVSCGPSFIFSLLCHRSAIPHFVAVRWPDGHTEVFDLTPEPVSSIFAYNVTPAFTVRPNTSRGSTLRAAPNHSAWWDKAGGNLRMGAFGTGGIYDPQEFELTDRAGTVYLLDKRTGLKKVTDRFGNSVEITPDGILLSDGPDILWQRNADGRIERLLLPDEQEIHYGYGTYGDLETVTDQLEQEFVFTYDGASHRMTGWGADGRQPKLSVEWDSNGDLLYTSDPGGVAVTEEVDGLQITRVGPDPRLTTTETYSGETGLLVAMTQSWDGMTEAPYVTTFGYDAKFQVNHVTLPTGAEQSVVYDALGRVVSETDAAGVTTTTTYGPFDQPQETRVAGEVVQRNVFDELGRVVRVERGEGAETQVVQRLSYMIGRRVEWIENGAGERVTLTYGPQGLPVSAVLPGARVATVTYDGAGRHRLVTKPVIGTTEHVYDALGQLKELIDPRGGRQTFEYDTYGTMTSYRSKPDVSEPAITYVYDDAGRLTEKTNRNDEVVAFVYDDAGRLKAVTDVTDALDPVELKRFTYDPLGRIVRGETPEHVHDQTWDVNGLTEMHAYGKDGLPHMDAVLGLEHDGAGRMTRIVGPGTTDVAYAYDSAGRLATVTEATIGAFTYAWAADGRIASLTRPNATKTTMSYDAARRVTAMTTVKVPSGDGVHELLYSYDNRGYPDAMTDPFGLHEYTHDDDGRLLTATHPSTSAIPNETYTYDSGYRRTSWAGHPSTEVVHDERDRLVQDAHYTYEYDAEGQRLSRTVRDSDPLEVTTYTWNALGQTVGLQEPDGTTWRFAYDAFDRRVLVERTISETTTTQGFVYDQSGLVRGATHVASSEISSFITGFGFGEVLAKAAGDQVVFPLRDHLGTPVVWLDAAGEVHELMTRDAFGLRFGTAAEMVTAYGYTGHAEDENGHLWGRARFLDPKVGAWISEDPAGGEPRYTYTGGRCSHFIDPTGGTGVDTTALTPFNVCAGTLQAAIAMYTIGINVGVVWGITTLTFDALKALTEVPGMGSRAGIPQPPNFKKPGDHYKQSYQYGMVASVRYAPSGSNVHGNVPYIVIAMNTGKVGGGLTGARLVKIVGDGYVATAQSATLYICAKALGLP